MHRPGLQPEFIVIVLFLFFQKQHFSFRPILITILVIVWAMRLGACLYVRVQHTGRDLRFDGIR